MKYIMSISFKSMIILIIIFIINPSISLASLDSMFSDVSKSQLSELDKKLFDIINDDPSTKYCKIVKVNKILYNTSLIIYLLDTLKINIVLKKHANYIKIIGSDENIYGSIFIIKDKIRGVVYYDGELYEIIPLISDIHLIKQVNQDKIPVENCDFKGDSFKDIIKKSSKDNSISTIQDECKIRILVAYTPNARNRRGGEKKINEDIQWAITLSNESYYNSNVNQRIELARSVLTNYTESGNWDTDVSRFFNPNDGYMDELEDIRDNYSADCMILIIDDGTWCGQAAGILANQNTARGVISAVGTCLASNYSFAHELGHLMGCRHQPGNDPNNSPFPYGHGYCDPDDNWRTIMSYRYNRDGSVCGTVRLKYWSNPDVYYYGTAMGTIQTHDNSRALDGTEETVNEFRLTPLNYTIPDETVTEYNIADILARSTLQTSEDFIAEENSEVTLRGGDEVILKPGFHAEYGSNFHAYIDDCEGRGAMLNEMSILENNNRKGKVFYLYYNIPNPFSSTTEIIYSLPEPSPVAIQIYNSIGLPVFELINLNQQQSGVHSVTFDASDLSAGVYFYMMRTPEYSETKQMVIMR